MDFSASIWKGLMSTEKDDMRKRLALLSFAENIEKSAIGAWCSWWFKHRDLPNTGSKTDE